MLELDMMSMETEDLSNQKTETLSDRAEEYEDTERMKIKEAYEETVKKNEELLKQQHELAQEQSREWKKMDDAQSRINSLQNKIEKDERELHSLETTDRRYPDVRLRLANERDDLQKEKKIYREAKDNYTDLTAKLSSIKAEINLNLSSMRRYSLFLMRNPSVNGSSLQGK